MNECLDLGATGSQPCTFGSETRDGLSEIRRKSDLSASECSGNSVQFTLIPVSNPSLVRVCVFHISLIVVLHRSIRADLSVMGITSTFHGLCIYRWEIYEMFDQYS